MDYDAMEFLTDLPSWMYMRATSVSKYVTASFKQFAPAEAVRKGVTPGAAFVALTPDIGGVLRPGTELLRAKAEGEGSPDVTLCEEYVFFTEAPPPAPPALLTGSASRRPAASPKPPPAPPPAPVPAAPASSRAADKRPAFSVVPDDELFAGAPIMDGFIRAAAAQPARRARPASAPSRCAGTATRPAPGS
jgi:hypothetical protein